MVQVEWCGSNVIELRFRGLCQIEIASELHCGIFSITDGFRLYSKPPML